MQRGLQRCWGLADDVGVQGKAAVALLKRALLRRVGKVYDDNVDGDSVRVGTSLVNNGLAYL